MKLYLEVVANTDIVSDAVAVQEIKPAIPDELPVGHNGPDHILAKEPYGTVDQTDTLLDIGVAALVQHGEQQREGNPLVDNTQHEDVDIGLSELPVRPVNTQDQSVLFGEQAEDQTRYQVPVQCIMSDEPLDAPQGGLGVGRGLKGVGQLLEGDRLHFAQGDHEMRYELYPCQIYLSLKMRAEN